MERGGFVVKCGGEQGEEMGEDVKLRGATATIGHVTKWIEHLRFEREVFNASLAGVDHSFPDRYETFTDS